MACMRSPSLTPTQLTTGMLIWRTDLQIWHRGNGNRYKITHSLDKCVSWTSGPHHYQKVSGSQSFKGSTCFSPEFVLVLGVLSVHSGNIIVVNSGLQTLLVNLNNSGETEPEATPNCACPLDYSPQIRAPSTGICGHLWESAGSRFVWNPNSGQWPPTTIPILEASMELYKNAHKWEIVENWCGPHVSQL